jgi:23S rRNA maturation-related 3'-5' exoribonuclease YhaM
MKPIQKIKERVESLLRLTEREGIEGLIKYMDENGFYEAPCSSQHHLCYEGGLAEHSLNVFDTMFTAAISIDYLSNTEEIKEIDKDYENKIIIVSLLHDLGKIGINGSRHYEPNVLKDGKISKSKPYETNKDLLGMPHEILSLEIISKFIELTIEEQQAILYHNGLYTPLGNGIKGKETPLYLLLHFSDMWASRVIEREE